MVGICRIYFWGDGIMNKKTIDGIRKYYQLPYWVTDDQIVLDLKGSLGEICVNIRIAKQKLKKSFIETLPMWIQKVTNG